MSTDNTMPSNLPYWIPAYYASTYYSNGVAISGYNAAMNPAIKDIGIFFPQNTSQLARLNAPSASTFTPFDAQTQASVWAGLKIFEGIIDVKFKPVSFGDAPGVINFFKADLPGFTIGAGLEVRNTGPGSVTLEPGIDPGAELHVLSHELMHALGLNHPYEGTYKIHPQDNGPLWTGVTSSVTDDPAKLTPQEQALAQSTYFSFDPRPLDIAAMQYLYGPSQTARTGNDTYALVEDNPNFIWDGIGIDTVDGSNLSRGLTLDLNPGTWGFIGAQSDHITAPGQVTVNYGSVIENVLGSNFADTITGNAADNVFKGFGGNDRFTLATGNDTADGGVGIDTVVLNGALSSYVINAFNPLAGSATLTSATDGRKDLSTIERVLFNNGTDGVAMDVGNGGIAGDVLKLVSLVLPGSANDKSILGQGIYLRDGGMSRDQLGEVAINFAMGQGSSNTEVVNLLWTNLFGKAPTAQEAEPYVQALDHGYFTRGSLASVAADLLDQHVGLTGVGYVEYTPFVA